MAKGAQAGRRGVEGAAAGWRLHSRSLARATKPEKRRSLELGLGEKHVLVHDGVVLDALELVRDVARVLLGLFWLFWGGCLGGLRGVSVERLGGVPWEQAAAGSRQRTT